MGNKKKKKRFVKGHKKINKYEKFSKIPDFDLPDICGQVEHTRIYMGYAGYTELSNKEEP